MKISPRYFTLFLMMVAFQMSAQKSQEWQSLLAIFEKLEKHNEHNDDLSFPDVSVLAQKKDMDFYASILDDLDKIDKDKLSFQEQINYDVFSYRIQNSHDVIKNQMYLIPFNAEGGFYNRMSYSTRRSYSSLEDYEKYYKRLRDFPGYFNQNIQLMRKGMEEGFVAPKVTAQNYSVLIQPFIEKEIEKNMFYKPFLERPNKIREEPFDKIRMKSEKIIRDTLVPLYEDFDRFMKEEYLPACNEKVGIAEVPGGRNLYEQRIKYFTSLEMSPDEVYNRGQSEVNRIRAEMEKIINEVGFDGSFSEFLHFLRTDSQFYCKTPKELLMHASYIAKKADGLLPKYFNNLPTLPYGVQPVPEAIASNYTGGRYSGGSWENHQAGNYWVNTYKLESRPLYVLPSLTLHEAVPGHHLQIALAQELKDLPKFRNNTYISAFGEGWALYTEWLGDEMGIYETPYEQFGRHTYEMWRACRLVVDVGMHYKGWTRTEAFDFLSGNTALSIHECNTEINRYIGWPGQAVSYKIGELTIKDLRQKCEATLGENFDIRKFHDKILENGSIPLFVLTDVIEQFIEDEKKEISKSDKP